MEIRARPAPMPVRERIPLVDISPVALIKRRAARVRAGITRSPRGEVEFGGGRLEAMATARAIAAS